MYTFVSEPNPLTEHEDCAQVFNHNLKQMPDPSTFHPTTNGTFVDQWMDTALAFGARYAILVTKHCDGFVAYATKAKFADGSPYTYSAEYSAWRGGKGDLLRDFVTSARRHGLVPGFYYSLPGNFYIPTMADPPTRIHPVTVAEPPTQGVHPLIVANPPTRGVHPVTVGEYYDVVMQQLREVWGNYGELGEIWFDGAHPFNQNATFERRVCDLARELQPNAILLQGPGGVSGGVVNLARKGDGETARVHDPNWSEHCLLCSSLTDSFICLRLHACVRFEVAACQLLHAC